MSQATQLAKNFAQLAMDGKDQPQDQAKRELAAVLYQLAVALEGIERQISELKRR